MLLVRAFVCAWAKMQWRCWKVKRSQAMMKKEQPGTRNMKPASQQLWCDCACGGGANKSSDPLCLFFLERLGQLQRSVAHEAASRRQQQLSRGPTRGLWAVARVAAQRQLAAFDCQLMPMRGAWVQDPESSTLEAAGSGKSWFFFPD
jgi:hypothetical protein